MKKVSLTFFLIALLGSKLFSQDKKIGLTLQVSNPIRDVKVGWFDIDMESIDNYNVKENSFAIGILGTYKVKLANYRVRINYTKIGIEEYHNQYSGGIRSNESATGDQNKITISPGITWTLNKDKLDVYFGFETPITFHGKFDYGYNSTQTDSTSGTLVSKTVSESEIPKGYSVGIGGIFGFNYFISSNFSVGAEFSPSILYSKLGGDVKSKYYNSIPPQTQGGVGVSEDKFTGFTHYENRFSFGVSFWFN